MCLRQVPCVNWASACGIFAVALMSLQPLASSAGTSGQCMFHACDMTAWHLLMETVYL